MKTAGKVLGLLLVLASLAYVAWSLHASGSFDSPIWGDPNLWLRTLMAGLGYGAALALIGCAWTRLVEGATTVRLGAAECVRIYALSQLYKYLPSNLLHYVGRQVMLKQRGVDHAAAAWGSLAEAAIIILASTFVAACFGYAYFAPMFSAQASSNFLILLAALGAIAALGIVVGRFRDRLPPQLAVLLAPRVRRAVIEAFALYAVFFFLAGCAFAVIAVVFAAAPPFAALVTIAAGSWVVGFVTPGASAGIGVREAVMIAALAQSGMNAGDAAVLALAYRVATTIGDVAFAGGAQAFLRRPAQA